MNGLLIFCFLVLITITYPKWSYKAYWERCEEDSRHPNFVPFSGRRRGEQ